MNAISPPSPGTPTPTPAPTPANDASPSRWDVIFAHTILIIEGTTFVDDPVDHGGATKFGLSLRAMAQMGKISPELAAELDINHDGAIDLPDIVGLTVPIARDIYFRYFWPTASRLPPPIDAAVFDQTVNDGLVPAVRMLQRAVNSLPRTVGPIAEDGLFGAETRQAVLAVSPSALLAAYRDQAANRYRTIVARDPSQVRFLDGWLRRARELGNV